MPLRAARLRRTAAVSVIAVAALSGLTACDLYAPQDTLYIESAIVGGSANVGDVFVGNAVLVKGDGDAYNLVATLVNEGGKTQHVTLAVSGGGSAELSLDPRETKKLGDPPNEQSRVTGLDAAPGSLVTVSVTNAGQSVGMQVPIVTGALPPYGTLTPEPSSTESPTGSPTPTPSPTPSR